MTSTTHRPEVQNPPPDIMSSEFAENPYPIYARLVEHFPLLWSESRRAWLISRYDDVEKAFKSHDFSTEPYWDMNGVMHGRSVINMDGREHAGNRALVAPPLRGAEFEDRVRPAIGRFADQLIDRFASRGHVDFVTEFAEELPLLVMRFILGLPDEDHEFFARCYRDKHNFFYNFDNDPEITARGYQARDDFEAYLLPLIDERRHSPVGDDLLSRLAHAEVDGQRLTDEEIKSFTSLLLAGGSETTTSTMSSLFMNLLLHRDQFDAVLSDRGLVPLAFAETVRYAVPNQIAPRRALVDVEFSAGTVPAGDVVLLLFAAANRDPRYFERPQEFDIFRSELDGSRSFTNAGTILSFGRGRHFCLGALLARNEVEIAANRILDRLADLRLTPGTTPKEEGHFSRGPKHLLLDFTPA